MTTPFKIFTPVVLTTTPFRHLVSRIRCLNRSGSTHTKLSSTNAHAKKRRAIALLGQAPRGPKDLLKKLEQSTIDTHTSVLQITKVPPYPNIKQEDLYNIQMACNACAISGCQKRSYKFPIVAEELQNPADISTGPSSSHYTGVQRGTRKAMEKIIALGLPIKKIDVRVHDSLHETGEGHGTPRAVAAGLSGLRPTQKHLKKSFHAAQNLQNGIICHRTAGEIPVTYNGVDTIMPHPKIRHPNGVRITFSFKNRPRKTIQFWSIGGGKIKFEDAPKIEDPKLQVMSSIVEIETQFGSFNQAYIQYQRTLGQENDVIRTNMMNALYTTQKVFKRAATSPIEVLLPNYMDVNTPQLFSALSNDPHDKFRLYIAFGAAAIMEENFRGNEVVSFPTKGSSGCFGAMIMGFCYRNGLYNEKEPAITTLIKHLETDPRHPISKKFTTLYNASMAIFIYSQLRSSHSAAEGGCSFEIGWANIAIAVGLAEVEGLPFEQVLTCMKLTLDYYRGRACVPVGGFVSTPCTERTQESIPFDIVDYVTQSGKATQADEIDQNVDEFTKTGQSLPPSLRETTGYDQFKDIN